MTIRHYLLGFDKDSGAVRQEWAIPAAYEPDVARILRLGAARLAMVDPRALTRLQAERVAETIWRRIDTDAHDYFVQAFDETPALTARQRAAAE